jgi:benzodiazapine receptor
MTTLKQAIALALSVGICFGAAGIGFLFTMPSLRGWYASLQRPAWAPPNWVFGPVWSALYLCMGVAAWLVWRRLETPGAKLALALFVIQLMCNVLWSALFFGIRNPGVAFGEIMLLWVLILSTLVSFRPISPAAGWLMVPYLLWVSFAAALNFVFWRLNR